MRGPLVLLAMLACGCAAARPDPPASRLDGHWRGTVAEGHQAIPIALDFQRVDGRLVGTMSLPSERLLGKALGDINEDAGTIAFTLPAHDAPLRFTGRIDGSRLIGEAQGGGRGIPLQLGRVPAPPPPPYREERLRFASGNVSLAGSLLLPPGPGPFPAVILIHGSSTPDRDDFRYFADLYARAGIAAFIYDKRPTGAETNGGTASLEVLAGDVLAAAAMLEARTDVDRNRIGLWGFSQGGWVAPIAASRHHFAFLTVVSAPGVSFAQVTLYADATRLRANGCAQADIDAALAAERRLDTFMRSGGDAPAIQTILDETRQLPCARLTTLPATVPSPAERRRYLRWIDLDLDPLIFWRGLRMPVLIAWGTGDQNVPAEASARRIAGALRPGDVTLRRYEGANHSLAPAPRLEADLIAWARAALRRGPAA